MSIPSVYLPYIAIAVFAGGVVLSSEWQRRIRPLFIPPAEIEKLADDLIERYGEQAEQFAAMEEDRAWRYAQSFEQGKWRRVRAALARRDRW
ncbi:hypothetical protein [Rhizobium sp. SSA_523]|uniref:hypothetical protein n=1 Tax=Rhizobium sp. SSA_523 TaxID=2952477 RepID=UPI002091C712|nr:hypothetical protein [Rhizobium sp. SSA_523]MCO5732970.1 hypothetical protein [Rhizobium sp. SSA_523]WKC23855.1 hypothetical protein QTJ18_24295 [Rhizobium sp. SSA_523]